MEAEYAYGAHFALRVLVLPVLPLRKEEYASQLALLRKHSRIALADVPPSSTGQAVNALLAPTPASRGYLNLNFVEAWDADLAWLQEFQAHRRVMGVVGLLDCAEWTGRDGRSTLADGGRAYKATLQERAPPGIFANRCYAFHPQENQNDNAEEGLVVIPNVGDLDFYTNTLLAELASSMLGGVSQMLAELDTKSRIDTPTGNPGSALRSSMTVQTPVTPDLEQQRLPFATPNLADRPSSPFSPAARAPSVPSPGPSHMTSSVSENLGSKARKKHLGRLAKLKGDLLCLGGRLSEAMNAYNEATVVTRANGDTAWQAAAMEANILAQTYQSWQHALPASRSPSATPQSSVADLTNLRAEAPTPSLHNPALANDLPQQYLSALQLYLRGSTARTSAVTMPEGTTPVASSNSTNAGDADSTIHPLLFVESCLRFARLQLVLLFRENAWDATSLALLVGDRATPAWPIISRNELFRLDLQGNGPRATIEGTVANAYTQLRDTSIRPVDRLQHTVAITNIYAALHLPRRTAAMQRELAAMRTLVVADDKKRLDTNRPNEGAQERTVVQSGRITQGADEILDLFQHVCRVHGFTESVGPQREENQVDARTSDRYFTMLETSFACCGFPELLLSLLNDAIRSAEMLSDYQRGLLLSIEALRQVSATMSATEQWHHVRRISSLSSAVARRSGSCPHAYWGPSDLLVSLELISLPYHLRPFRRLSTQRGPGTKLQGSIKDEIHYQTKRREAVDSDRPILVSGEEVHLVVTLENSLAVDLHIDSIKLETSGIKCSCVPTSFTIPPYEEESLQLSCTPEEPGSLLIHGCTIVLGGSNPITFLLPVNNAKREEEALRKYSVDIQDSIRGKPIPVERWQTAKSGLQALRTSGRDCDFLHCEVVPRLPLLSIRSSNLAHQSAMLYAGEHATIALELANHSSTTIDSLMVSFSDDFSEDKKQAFSGEDLSALEVYELEEVLFGNPCMKLHNPSGEALSVPPLGRKSIEVECLARLGMSNAQISISYGCLQPAKDSEENPSQHGDFARQLYFDAAISVYPSLEVVRWDITNVTKPYRDIKYHRVRSGSISSVGRSLAIDQALEEGLRNQASDDLCLMVLEVRNLANRQAFEASLCNQSDKGSTVKERVEPDTAVNILVPLKKFRLEEEEANRPIPSRSSKQFVVGKETVTALDRELFWYRQEIVKQLSLTWREIGTRRSGGCSLQHLWLTPAMLSAIKVDDLQIGINISQDGSACEEGSGGDLSAVAGSFLAVTCSVQNCRDRDVSLTAKLVVYPGSTGRDPSSQQAVNDADIADFSSSPHVVIDGSSTLTIPLLGPKETCSVPIDFSMCLLSRGSFTLVIQFYETAAGQSISLRPEDLVRAEKREHLLVV